MDYLVDVVMILGFLLDFVYSNKGKVLVLFSKCIILNIIGSREYVNNGREQDINCLKLLVFQEFEWEIYSCLGLEGI